MTFHHSVRSRRLYRSRAKIGAESGPAHERRILVVDDEALQRQLVAEDLLLNGYRVFQAGNAFQALALLSSPEMFDLVLTDIDMPGDFNGIDLARLVKDTAPATKVILISGRDHAPGNIASIDLHLRKPITSVRLRAVIARMLEPASPLERPSA